MLRTTDIKDYTVDWDSLPFCEVTEKRGDIQRFLLKKGDLIIARAGTTGISVLIEKDFENVIFGSYLIKVRLSRKVHPKFMRYFCQSRLYWDHITSSQAGSTLKNISLPVLRSLNVPLPSSIEEQQKIAEILSTVDEAIRKTNEVIAKTERLKKGLMQELLTKGIGHKEFKDTEIGRIPKEWEVVKLNDVTMSIKDGMHNPPKRVPYGIPLLSARNIIDGKIVRLPDDTYITPQDYDGLSERHEIKKGDVLLTIVGTIGRSAVVRSDPDFAVQRSVAIIRPNNKLVTSDFLHVVFQSPSFQKQLISRIKLTTQSGVYLRELGKIPLPLPSLPEQQRIAEILFTIDKKLEIGRNEKAKLERIKQGLMDLLLTGKIRVKV
jgi:type I restriction enzyme S subunit